MQNQYFDVELQTMSTGKPKNITITERFVINYHGIIVLTDSAVPVVPVRLPQEMGEGECGGNPPQDLVAIFHASFHPTKGNVVDWSLKASDDLNLDQLQLEFNALPSGLHLVERDVVYFTKENQHGVCIFRRRQTEERGHRGFRLSSLGILLAKSVRPRPWRHVKALKALTDTIYSSSRNRGSQAVTDEDWEPARVFFEERKLRRADLGGAGDWTGWSDELDGAYADPLDANPTIHLSHLLRILGPSSLTLYKHVLGRKRILIYTLPPVEVACFLCQIAGDICFEAQVGSETEFSMRKLHGTHRVPISVLGMVTLSDLDRLEAESRTGRGWIACTTDAIFMEKPSYYDLFIDLTTSTPNKSTRPSFYSSKPVTVSGSSRPTHRLSTIRFAWSDVKIWNEIDRILHLDNDTTHSPCCSSFSDEPKTVGLWTDAWRVYEDVCIICAGLWVGSWRGNSAASYSTVHGPENWGGVRLEGDDDLTLSNMLSEPEQSAVNGSGTAGGGGKASGNNSQRTYMRNLGMGIEGRPFDSLGGLTSKSTRRASAMSWSSGKATVVGIPSSTSTIPGFASDRGPSEGSDDVELTRPGPEIELNSEDLARRRMSQVSTTLALLQTFHAHTAFQLSVLEDLLKQRGLKTISSQTIRGASPSESETVLQAGENFITLTSKDVLSFELGPFSSLDAKYLDWLAAEYAGVKVNVRRGWRDLFDIIFGFG